MIESERKEGEREIERGSEEEIYFVLIDLIISLVKFKKRYLGEVTNNAKFFLQKLFYFYSTSLFP